MAPNSAIEHLPSHIPGQELEKRINQSLLYVRNEFGWICKLISGRNFCGDLFVYA